MVLIFKKPSKLQNLQTLLPHRTTISLDEDDVQANKVIIEVIIVMIGTYYQSISNLHLIINENILY